ncbi:MAG: FixH family protein [Thermoanaerobaculales bacterium]|jgi:nitrogen fixation protein FixH|nr:FixH family protein [Thermoanaerobaculales bacterium]
MKIKPGVLWPAVIAGALALHVLVMAAMVWVATTNDSYAVEPDYYAKALAWDERRAQERRNAELGWRLEFTVVPAAEGADPVLRATLVDDAGVPVTGARIAAEAFSNVRRDEVLTAILGPSREGYEAAIPMHGNGRWELRFEVTRDQDVYTHRDTRHIYTELPE